MNLEQARAIRMPLPPLEGKLLKGVLDSPFVVTRYGPGGAWDRTYWVTNLANRADHQLCVDRPRRVPLSPSSDEALLERFT